MKTFFFIANAALGKGLSGSDRIFMELAKRWSSTGDRVYVAVWEEGYDMCQRERLTNVHYRKWFLNNLKNIPFILNYFLRIFSGIYYACTESTKFEYIYACSDFWQDAIPALILKVRYPKSKLIGSFYLAAPNPFRGYNEAGKFKMPTLKETLYFLQQQPIYWLLRINAEYIFVTSEPDRARFPKQNSKGKCLVIKGGVDLEKVHDWKIKLGNQTKIYDAVFLGRFHPQKGVIELIDIWKEVVSKKNDAKLVLLGDGPLMDKVKEKISKYYLKENIIIKGYVFDGEEKYRIFSQSKLALHPAVYDSGGMAAAEAMAWDLPAISFDLEALKTYYPYGMIKVPLNDNLQFAKEIIRLLEDAAAYEQTKLLAQKLIATEWSWSKRAELIRGRLN